MNVAKAKELNALCGKIIDNDDFVHPYRSKLGCRSGLQELTQKYCEFLQENTENKQLLRGVKDNLDVIRKISDSLVKCIDFYLIGNPGQALDEMKSIFNDDVVRCHIKKITIPLCEDEITLFRVRESPGRITKREEMFHIPFDSRHLIGTQRYSISGVPCLYLGGSAYICWEEMNRPSFDKVYISSFRNKCKLSILDLGFGFDQIKRGKSFYELIDDGAGCLEEIDKLQSSIILFPLIMGCSFAKMNPNSKFHEEYIIPGLILQWVNHFCDELDGIRYISTLKHFKNSKDKFYNYVFPTKMKAFSRKRYCEKLASKFEISNPLSWIIAESVGPKNVPSDNSEDIIEIEPNVYLNYTGTVFEKVECALTSRPKLLGAINSDLLS